MSPKKLDRFEIISEFGASDLMSVYLAKDPREERTVVLRSVRLDAAEPELAARIVRFREDAKRACTLDSPNIGKFYEHGEADGCIFLVSEYVVGDSLRKQIDENKDFSLNDILDLTRQACSAFDHAHSRDVAACNLRPSKFVIESDGTLKIMDFGLSETIGQQDRPALHYRSPEEFRGEKPDLRSNLFSWGAVLYEVVTGQKAFPGFDEESIRQGIMENIPPSPEELLPGMPPGVSAAIMKALKKSFNDRYVRGAEMVRALEDYKNYKAENTPLPFMLQQHVRAGAASRLVPDSKPSPRIAAATISPPKPAVPSSASQVPSWSTPPAAPAPPALAAPTSDAPRMSTAPAMMEAATPAQSLPAKPAAPAVDSAMPAAAPPTAERPRGLVDMILSEYAPAKKAGGTRKSKPPASTPPAMPSWRASTSPAETVPQIDPAGPAMPPRATLPPMSSRNRLLVYASVAVLVALTALFSASTHFRKVSASQPPVPPVSAVSTDPAFSEPFAPKQVAQVAPPKPAVAFEIDDAPPKVKHPKHAPAPAKVVATPAAPVSGDLSVTTNPAGARVQIDGRGDIEWVSPCVVTGLTPGQHVLTISKPGFVVSTRAVDVIAGGRSDVSVPMALLGATLTVNSTPAGAAVLVDGKNTGRVTPAQLVVPHGKHAVVVQKAGYIDMSTSAEFSPGQTFKFEPALQPMGNVDRMRSAGKGIGKLFGKIPEGMGRVTFRTDPRNAQIMLNNRVLDHDTPTDVFLEPGSYQVTLSLPGYKSVQKVISVESGSKLAIDETLQK